MFSISGLRLYFPALEPKVARSVSGLPVAALPQSSLPGCPSPPLLLVWVSVSFYLLGCQTSIQFDFLSVLVVFVFKFVDALLLVVRGGTVCLTMPPTWPEVFL